MKKELNKNKDKTIDDIGNELISTQNDLFNENESNIKTLDEISDYIGTEELGHHDCHIQGLLVEGGKCRKI